MLNKVRIFKLHFTYYLYWNSNAGNSIFVCKSAKRINSRMYVAMLVHSDSCGVWMQATGHVSLKSVGKGEGWVLLQ